MLATIADLQNVPYISQLPVPYLEMILAGADRALKTWLKRNIETATYTEYYDGNGTPDLVLKSYPVQSITSLWLDMNGNYGQTAGSFGAGTLQVAGTQYALEIDSGGTTSNRGLVRAIGTATDFAYGFGDGWGGLGGDRGKLYGSRLAGWPAGFGNIKVQYVGGYTTVPPDLNIACVMLCSAIARGMPRGGLLTSENLGGYSFSVGSGLIGSALELGTVRQMCARYRQTAM